MSSSPCHESIASQSISIELHQTLNSRQELKYAIERLAAKTTLKQTPFELTRVGTKSNSSQKYNIEALTRNNSNLRMKLRKTEDRMGIED
jgi:hypothetical protein